jgi:hypothetical protein
LERKWALLERNISLLMELMEVFLLMVDKEYEEKLLDIPRNLHSIEHEIRILQTLSLKVRVKRWA